MIVVGVGLKNEDPVEIKLSLAELENLVFAAGGEVVGSAMQIVPSFIAATLIGSGKLLEIKSLVEETGSNLVVIDLPLKGSQSRNIQNIIGVNVIDRHQLILDIFAQRAQTFEGKLQVELAQMLDQLPRMIGAWQGSLSRQGGGIGARGPGETALEMDRRRIRHRMKVIREKLEDVRAHRAQYRAKRRKHAIPSFALIGYTNSGKSTLLNALTQAQAFVKDQVFATLDPLTRKVHLGDLKDAVLTDTVGFIRKLPPQLIDAFKATLEESSDADILLHVIDLASNEMDQQMKTVQGLIEEFGWQQKPIIHVFNKTDVAPFEKQFKVKAFPRVFVSATTGHNLNQLKSLMLQSLDQLKTNVNLYFPKDQEHRLFELGRETDIVTTQANAVGTECTAKLTPTQISKWREYLS